MTKNELPIWMTKCDSEPLPYSRQSFAERSVKSVLSVLSKLRMQENSNIKFRFSASLGMISVLLFIVLNACAKNMFFPVILAAAELVCLCFFKPEQIKRVVSTTVTACVFTALIMLFSVFTGNPQTLMKITLKVGVSVTLIGEYSFAVGQNSITTAFAKLHLPGIFIFTLDTAMRFIIILGEICLEMLYAVKLRMVGGKCGLSFGGICGTLFLKSKKMSVEMSDAMTCRCFDGTYIKTVNYGFTVVDAVIIAGTVGGIAFFAYLEAVL